MPKPYKILFKYTTRSRPEFFHRGMRSILDNLASDNYKIQVTADADDESMKDAFVPYADNSKIHFYYGASNNKIHAINRDLEFTGKWDILVNMSDDMVFTVNGFDNIIRNDFDGNLDQLLMYPDGNTHEIVTLSIMGRTYFERDKYIYHPSYLSLFCDNEATIVARNRGCLKTCYQQIFDHKHWAFGKAVVDEQYTRTERQGQVDSHTFKRREQLGFPN